MKLHFSKYQGAGNDFVMIDNRNQEFPKDKAEVIAHLCDRRFGIGADGLILLENHQETDFRMVYFNADGKESTMCGNGGRCIMAFARQLGVIQKEAEFIAIDGLHHAEILEDGRVALGMKDVQGIEQIREREYILNTGSPHYVILVDKMPEEIVELAKNVRYSDRFADEGINVNFIQIVLDQVKIRTYERGVEAETLACGTGSVAAAIVASRYTGLNSSGILTRGGILHVSFDENLNKVILTGAAKWVFDGNIQVKS